MADLKERKILERARLTLARRVFPVKRPPAFFLDELEIALKEAKVSQVNIPSITPPKVMPDFCPQAQEIFPITVGAIPAPQITSDISLVGPELIQLNVFPPYVQIITCPNGQCLKNLRVQIDALSVGKQLKITCPSCHRAFLHSPTREEVIADLTTWLKEQLICPQMESFSVALQTPGRAGKSYRQVEAQDKQAELFEEQDKVCIHGLKKSWCSTCIQKERREAQIATSRVDPFDLIFPILQPPLGENFDSPVAFPSGKELKPFQREGVKFLAEHERALLGDEMGLGKSIQAIVALRFLFRVGKITNGLLLCPKSVLTDWEKKLWEWAPELRVIKVRGLKEQREILWSTPGHIYVTTYETLRQDLSGSLGDNNGLGDTAKNEFDFIILDEIQKIKNPDAAISKAARLINARIRWGLSGTPLENRLEELVSIFAYLKPGLLHYAWVSMPWEIKKAIKPYLLRRRKTDALPDLPEKVPEEAWLELTPAQKETYDKAEQEGIVALNEQGDAVTVQHVLALITKLKQICNIDPKSKESCKLEYLLEKLEDVSEQDDKALVFSQYPEKTLKQLEPELSQFNPLIYSGSLSDSQRDDIVKRFQETEDNRVLLMSVRAGGLGLTLTRANYVYHYDLWWNPAVAAQAEDRAHRIGQEKTVFVTSLFTVDTIEERIQNLLNKKRQLFKEVIDDLSDTNLSRVLTEDELFGLFNIQRKKQDINESPPRRKVSWEALSRISPQGFEELIAKLFETMGYHVKLTPQTRDRGVDVYAKRVSDAGTENLAIQCKHYANSVVGVEHARSLYGVIQDQPSITKGILVTSGRFSSECRDFARGKRIELIDVNHLLGLFEKYNVSLAGN